MKITVGLEQLRGDARPFAEFEPRLGLAVARLQSPGGIGKFLEQQGEGVRGLLKLSVLKMNFRKPVPVMVGQFAGLG